ncbi:MAG: pilus assembly protein [Planctomycetes bacterium]|nr:pilus assembly protein [Planctomycetota bacterium]
MKYRRSEPRQRRGVAAMELALVLPLVVLLMFGIWDVGRMVEVEQIVANAAREGARQAAVGSMLDESTGGQKNIYTTDIQQTVLNYLARNGLNTSNVAIQFQDLSNPGATDPYQADHLDHLRVTVQMPFNDVRWTPVNNILQNNTTQLTGSADWFSLKDIDVTVSTSLPTN